MEPVQYSNISNASSASNLTVTLLTREQIYDFITPRFYQWIYISLFFIVFVVGLAGNFLVCYSVKKSQSLKSVTNYFLVNLAVADFLVILICLPMSVITDALQSWIFGLFMCKITFFLQCVSVFVSVLTLMAISVERYLAICHPLEHFGTYFKTKLIIIVIWIVSLGIPSVPAYNMVVDPDPQVPESLQPLLNSCHPDDSMMQMRFQIFLISVFYVLPFTVMSFTYVKIALCLWSSASARNAVSQNLRYESAMEHLQMRRRTAKMLIVVVFTFGMCYLPINLLNIVRYTGVVDQLSLSTQFCLFWTARLLIYFSSAINPVIYNFMSAKFREQFKTACFGCYTHLGCLCQCCTGKRKVRKKSTEMSRGSDTVNTNLRSTFISETRAS